VAFEALTARERIRGAALEHVARDGYHRATKRAIAESAGVSPGCSATTTGRTRTCGRRVTTTCWRCSRASTAGSPTTPAPRYRPSRHRSRSAGSRRRATHRAGVTGHLLPALIDQGVATPAAGYEKPERGVRTGYEVEQSVGIGWVRPSGRHLWPSGMDVQRHLDGGPQPNPCSGEQLVRTRRSDRRRGRRPGSPAVVCRNCWRSVGIATRPFGSRCARSGSRIRPVHAT